VALAERRRLKATARTCAAVLAGHMRGSRFAPAALETDFGVEDGMARLTVNAVSGECTLEGRIDRIDEWAEGGYLRVIDYKRGGKPLALDEAWHGLSLQLPVYLAAATRKRREKSAGVYYFSLDEGILAMQSTDPDEVANARRESFRLNGLAPDDMALLEAQSPNFTQVLNVKVNTGGGLRKGTLATDAHGFEALMKKTLDRAGEHLDAIRAGLAQVAPATLRQQNACKYCDWRPICLFDERLDGRCVRRFETIRADEVLERLKLEK
jgi:ATP-dependent helicase/nuclease subunit B